MSVVWLAMGEDGSVVGSRSKKNLSWLLLLFEARDDAKPTLNFTCISVRDLTGQPTHGRRHLASSRSLCVFRRLSLKRVDLGIQNIAPNISPSRLLEVSAKTAGQRAMAPPGGTDAGNKDTNNVTSTPSGSPVTTRFISADFGTTKLMVTYWVGKPGVPPEPSAARDVRLGAHADHTTSRIALEKQDDGTYRLLWGKYTLVTVTDAVASEMAAQSRRYVSERAELEKAIEAGTVSAENIIEQLKLSIYRAHSDNYIADTAERRLKACGFDAETVLQELFRQILQKSLSSMSEDWFIGFSKEVRSSMPTVLFISVPEAWDPPENRIMSQAAKKTGLVDRVQLVYEAHASAAFYFDQLKNNGQALYLAGEQFILLDAGGGTTDGIRLQQKSDSNDGAAVKLHKLAPSESDLCGSEFVDAEFLKWLPPYVERKYKAKPKPENGEETVQNNIGNAKKRKKGKKDKPKPKPQPENGEETLRNDIGNAKQGKEDKPKKYGLEALLEDLDISKDNFLEQAKHGFSQQKTTKTTKIANITVSGKDCDSTGLESGWPYFNRMAEMRQFFEPVVKKNVDLVSALLKDSEVKFILVAGGFSKSRYLMEALENAFGKDKVKDVAPSVALAPHPVARGVALRYQDVIDISVPPTDCFGISQDEHFDDLRHPDGLYEKGDQILSRRGNIPAREGDINKRIVMRGKYDDELWVEERWVTLMKPGETGPVDSAVWQWDFIEEAHKDQPLKCQIYWTKTRIKDGSHIQQWGGEAGMRRDVMHWGPPLIVKAPDWHAHGFRLTTTKKKQGKNFEGFHIFWRLKMAREGGNVSLLWELAPPLEGMPAHDYPSEQTIHLVKEMVVDQNLAAKKFESR
ncbi:uncharacterized protein MYCFIDRAFT_172851 [Pseudocercospora fijiensis CIRAD86]|uniref:Uncharacterized protein n=1 Tax=Pseudocercospora fijiensis (strain CIRAD86) TaxID=383855 RepID=M3AGV4_PSEFD|nr:uncharacterized protein MYCFIDRAFT_172851 [Pseudocercospora fijiensis CIRAD86]EME83776.1 hypothetical protein MYCFIDRAFT_172851 [Pseudocercospora fijiensis CIRAD86]